MRFCHPAKRGAVHPAIPKTTIASQWRVPRQRPPALPVASHLARGGVPSPRCIPPKRPAPKWPGNRERQPQREAVTFPPYQNLTAGVDNWGAVGQGKQGAWQQHMDAIAHKTRKGFNCTSSSSNAIGQPCKGFSLVEAAIVLAVVGGVIGAIWGGAATMIEDYRVSKTTNDIALIVKKYAESYKYF